MADLIRFLADGKVETEYSCEADGGHGYILFPSGADFERAVLLLAGLAAEAGEWQLRARVLQMPFVVPPFAPEPTVQDRAVLWRFEVRCQSLEGRGLGPASPGFDYIMRIPVDDVRLISALCRWVNAATPRSTG